MDNSLKTIVAKLEDLFEKFNAHFYESKLETPIITVSPDDTKGALGWFTSWRSWHRLGSEDEGYYEINICAESLARPFPDICETLLHEMVHLHCKTSEIKDTSRGGSYHNKKYKEEAELHGLIVEQSQSSGWNMTKLNPEADALIRSLDQHTFDLYRKKLVKLKTSGSKSSSRKYVCPDCGMSIRATKEVRVMCADCDTIMEVEE
jgi:hypothetical protein